MLTIFQNITRHIPNFAAYPFPDLTPNTLQYTLSQNAADAVEKSGKRKNLGQKVENIKILGQCISSIFEIFEIFALFSRFSLYFRHAFDFCHFYPFHVRDFCQYFAACEIFKLVAQSPKTFGLLQKKIVFSYHFFHHLAAHNQLITSYFMM
jgi:hypothetical protein